MGTMRNLFLILFLLMIPAFGAGAEPRTKTLYLIDPFENRNPDKNAYWIGEALSDLISQVAAEKGIETVTMKERNDAFAEFGFSQLAIPTLASQMKIAEHLQASHLIYGSFDLKANLLTIQGSIVDFRKLSRLKTFDLSITIGDLLLLKKKICESLFKGGDPISCPDSLQFDYGDAISIKGYEAFIKASFEDSSSMKEELYRKALQLSPSFSRALYELGFLYYTNSQPDSAEEVLIQILDRKSKVAGQACLLLGEIYLESGRFSHSVEILKKAVSYGGTGKAHYLLAKAYCAAGDIESASRELDISLKLDPADIEARSFFKELQKKK